MYTDEDLNTAVREGIFSKESVSIFRQQLSQLNNTASVDEENFRLISGFNDIFVVIACLLLLYSSSWVLNNIDEIAAKFILPCLAWGLAEFFVRLRKMALPAIVLLLYFAIGIYDLGLHLFQAQGELAVSLASALLVAAAGLHWWRFRVPLTIAVAAVSSIAFFIYTVLSVTPSLRDWVTSIVFLCGVMSFMFAMYWDGIDRTRQTHHSDVAFWLHLISAPLIVHPVFSNLSFQSGDESLYSMLAVVVLYLIVTVISLVIDRRVFMVSSMAYVIYALSNFLESYGAINSSLAITGVCIGALLLILSAFWQSTRTAVLSVMPKQVKQFVPVTKI